MKIALLIGNQPNHIALADKLNRLHKLDLTIVETRSSAASKGAAREVITGTKKIISFRLHQAWRQVMEHYRRQYSLPQYGAQIGTANVNNEEVIAALDDLRPDIVLVSGTRLIKKPLIEAIGKYGKIINLHTGLSPYIKGGPNCTNWCLAEGKPQFIGNTIMWLDAGIDSGNIITTAVVPVEGITSLYELHLAVLESAHELYLRTVKALLDGRLLPSVKQTDIAPGKTYYTREWTLRKQLSALRNFRKFFPLKQPPDYSDIKTVALQ